MRALQTKTKGAAMKGKEPEPEPKDSHDRVHHPTLPAAICAVMADVGTVRMTGKLPVGYGRDAKEVNIASIADIAGALQPILARHGVAMIPAEMDWSATVHGKTKSGIDMHRVDVRVTYCLHHADSDQTITLQSVGQGTDTGDKAAYKAMTGAQKYAHRLTFHLPTEHDPDQHQSVETSSSAPQQRRAPASSDTKAPLPSSSQRASGNGVIDAAQRKRIWATAFGAAEKDLNRKPDDDERNAIMSVVRGVMDARKYSSTTEITVADFVPILKAIDEAVHAMKWDLGPDGDIDSADDYHGDDDVGM